MNILRLGRCDEVEASASKIAPEPASTQMNEALAFSVVSLLTQWPWKMPLLRPNPSRSATNSLVSV